MTSLAWKINRLRTMGAGEITWRVKNAVQKRLEKKGWMLALQAPSAQLQFGRAWLPQLPRGFDTALYIHAADAILAGKFNVFAMQAAELGFPPNWNRDPKTGKIAPLTFGKTLDYRDERIVGNIKYLWEPNRHYELVSLAQAWHLSLDAKYLAACAQYLNSWFAQAPYPLGVSWSSSLENALRIGNWSVAWHLLGGEKSPLFAGEAGLALQQRWLDSIYQHCHFIGSHFSLYSSANNHLLGEYMGLFIGATTWPCWRESAGWRRVAKRGLEEQALIQNALDGVNLEQGIWYHHEVADMLLINGLLGRANGDEFSSAYWQRLEAMLEFILAMLDKNGNMTMWGDSDDALMVRFSQQADFHPYRALLATGAVLFQRADFAAKAAGFEDKSRWLLGDGAQAEYAAIQPSSTRQPKREFPQGGYYILGSEFETDNEVKIIADCGPLGFLSIAAHGHADALSFTLSIAGQPILIDPGTYAYRTEQKWRDYFKGSSAHNTVRVDGVDQSVSGGNFMWLTHANAKLERWHSDDAADEFCGSHDGYMRLPDPVAHQRSIRYDKQTRQIVVQDVLQAKLEHSLEFFWQIDDRCTVSIEGKQAIVRAEGVLVRISTDSQQVPSQVSGQETPPQGWISRRFDAKTPCASLCWRENMTGKLTRTTVIEIELDDANR